MSRKGMEFTEDDDDFVVTPKTKHRFNLNGTPNIKSSSCSPSSGRLLGNTQRTPSLSSVQTLGTSGLSKGVNGNGKVYRMVQNIQHSMTAQGNRSQVHRTSNDEAVSKAGIKEGVWLNTSPKKNQQSNSYMLSGSQALSISQTSELKANSSQVKLNKSNDTVSSSSSISKLSQSSVDKSLVGISRPSFTKTNKPFSLYTFPKSPQETLDCTADKLPPEDDVVETPATSTVKTSFNAASRVELTQFQKHRKVKGILKSIDGKYTASRNDITAKRSYGNSVSENDWLDNKVKKVRSNYKCIKPVVPLCKIDGVMNLNTASPGQDEKFNGKRAHSDSEWCSDQSDIVIAETPLNKSRKRVQKIESDSDESEEPFDSKQSGMSDTSHVEFLSIKNSHLGKSDISESEISDSTHMDIDSLSNGTIEEILSSSDEQVNTTVSTENDPESPVPVNKQRIRPNFVLDKFGTESSSESDCPTSHSLVGRYSKKGKERDNHRARGNHRATERGHMGSYTFPINKQSKLYNSTPRKKSEKSHAVKNRKISAEKPFGSGMGKRKYANQRLKRRLSLSPDSGELPTISRPKQRRVCKLKSLITLDETISSSDSETLDGERSWVVSGEEKNIPNTKISDTSVLETFSDPCVDTSGTGEFLTLVESPTVVPCEQFSLKDVQILSLSTSEDSDVPLMELLERRKEKEPLTTSKLSDKSGEKSIKFDVTSVKQEIVSLGYLEKTLPSTSVIDEQSKDVNDKKETLFKYSIDSDEQDKLRKRKNHPLMDRLKISKEENEDDNNTISFQDTEDSVEEDKQKNRQIHSLLEKLKETIKSVKKDKRLASASPSVSLSPLLHQNTGKTMEHFGKEMNENDKNDIHEKTSQLQNMEINTLDIPVLVNNKKHVGADVSVKTEPISSYTQEPECIFIDDDDDIDDEFLRSLSQRVDFIDVDDGDKEGEEETNHCYSNDEGTVEDVNVKVEMDSEGSEIKDPEYWEDYSQMSDEDSDGYGNLSEPSLMERSALGTVKKIKTEMDTPKEDCEKVSAGRNALSSKENNHSLVVKTEIHSDVELDNTIEENNSGHDKQEDDGLISADFLSEDDDVLYAAATQVDSDLASKASTSLCRTVKLERTDEDVCSGKSKISKEEMDSDDDIYLAETQLDVQELRKDSLGHRSLQVVDDKTDPYLAMTQENCITAKSIKGMEMFNGSYLTPAMAPARKNFVSLFSKHQQDQVKDWMDGSISGEDSVSFYSEMTQVDSQDKQRLEVSRADDIDALHEAYMEQTQIKFCKTTKSTSHMVRDPEDDEIEDDSVYNAQTQVDPSLRWKPQESRNNKDQIEYPGTKEKTRLAEVLKDSHAGTPKAVDKTPKRVSVSSGENVSKQISPLLSHATGLGLNSAHTVQTEVSVAKSVSVRRYSKKDAAQRRTLEIEPQRKKSTKEMRMEFKAANFYPSKHQGKWSSGAAEMYLEETSDSRSHWLSKNSKITPEKSKPVQEKKISYKDTAIKKSKDRKCRKSQKKLAFSLTQAIQDAKCRLVDRNFQTVVRPESLAEGYKKKLATVASEDVEDVELPTDSQIMNQGLPLLCPKNPLLTSRKKSPSSGPHIATSSNSLESVRTSNKMVSMANSSTVNLSSVSSVNSLSVVTTSVNNSCPLSAGGTVTTVSTTYREPLFSTSRKSAAVSSSSFDREKVVSSTGRSSNPTSRESSVEDVVKSPGLHENQTGFLAIGSPAMDLVSSILAQSKSDVPHFKLSNSSHGSNVTEKSPLVSSVMNRIDVKRGSKETNVKHKEKDAQKVQGACVNMAEKTKDVTKKSRDSRVNSLFENIKPKDINGRMSNKDHHQRRHSVETSSPRVGDGREVSQPLKVEIDNGKRKGSDEGMTNRDNHKRRHSVETSCLKVGDSREVSQPVRIQIEKKPKGSDEGMSNRDCHKESHSVEISMHKVGDSREVSQSVKLQDKGKHNDMDRNMSGKDHHNRRHPVETSRHKVGDSKGVNQPEWIKKDMGNKPVNAVAPMQINSLLPDLEKVAMVTESTSQSELLNRTASPLPDQQRQLSSSGGQQNEGHSAAQVENCTKEKISTVTTIKKAQINSSALCIERQHQVHSVALMQNLTDGIGTTVNHSVSEGANPTSTFQGGVQTNASSLFNGQEQQDKLNIIGEIPLSDDQKKLENSAPDVSATTAVEVSVIDNMKAGLSVKAETNFVVDRVYELKADSVADAVPTGSSLNRLLPGKMFTSRGLVSQQFDQQLSFYGGHVQTSRDSRKVARQNSNDTSRLADTKHNPSLASFRAMGPAAQQVASSSSNLMRLDCQTKLPQLDDFLIFLLKWNPVWLNEQKDKLTKENRPAEPPPVAGEQRPFPLVEKYSSFDEYCHMFMVPLLLYEAWECCFRDWKTRKDHKNTICHKMYQGGYLIDKEHQRSSCKIVEYVGHALITREDWNGGRYINEGDLVWLNIFGVMTYDNKNKSSQPDWFPQMAYVDSISIKTDGRSVLRVLKMIPQEGWKRPDMYVYMKFVFKIRWRKFRPVHEQPSEVHQISSIITTIRQYQALSLLPRSPLCQDILNPTCNLTFLDKETYVVPSLKIHYNSSQAEAIATITKMVLSPYVFPKICLLQGPPGTGKSYTIIALIKKIMKDTNGNAKICVCAPSNAAVDVLMKRLVDYSNTRPDTTSALRCVRIGKLNTMHPDVQSYSFIKLMENKVESLKLEKRKTFLPKSLINQHSTLLEKISVKKTELKSASGDSHKIARIKSDLKALEKDKRRIENQMDAQADVRLSPEEESNLRRNILLKANIIAGTLCGLGASLMNNITKKDDKEAFFKCIIVDEATQATELDCLIPLQYGSSKLVLVGDPEQLPPTVVSQVAAENKFGQSLFERFYNHFKYTPNNPVMMLNTQYRMDLEICSFPNSYIYERKIQTDLTVRNRSQRFDLEPYLVFDVCDGHELQSQSGSVSNLIEAEFTVKLCKFVLQTQKMNPCDIGIIAPYQNQKKLLHDLLGKSNIRGVEVGTVDGFQGREKSVIIMSCVRAKNPTGTIGFVGSRQRMNVALTRAKYACYIVGHIESLQTNEEWRALINDAKERQRIIPIKSNHDAEIMLQCCRKTKTKGKSDIS
ncbi:hypothetical protein CHS0354_020293 [Potamilus streckersoni]|uniref:Uncharacterized protein n=1 Tax=Potamilus streckersoni TaxID=2493646 RepID=A0AAE0S5K4_9BIVA|nr:hypothetical protein CHS0354_020293 [Potamilus streckersoni]